MRLQAYRVLDYVFHISANYLRPLSALGCNHVTILFPHLLSDRSADVIYMLSNLLDREHIEVESVNKLKPYMMTVNCEADRNSHVHVSRRIQCTLPADLMGLLKQYLC